MKNFLGLFLSIICFLNFLPFNLASSAHHNYAIETINSKLGMKQFLDQHEIAQIAVTINDKWSPETCRLTFKTLSLLICSDFRKSERHTSDTLNYFRKLSDEQKKEVLSYIENEVQEISEVKAASDNKYAIPLSFACIRFMIVSCPYLHSLLFRAYRAALVLTLYSREKLSTQTLKIYLRIPALITDAAEDLCEIEHTILAMIKAHELNPAFIRSVKENLVDAQKRVRPMDFDSRLDICIAMMLALHELNKKENRNDAVVEALRDFCLTPEEMRTLKIFLILNYIYQRVRMVQLICVVYSPVLENYESMPIVPEDQETKPYTINYTVYLFSLMRSLHTHIHQRQGLEDFSILMLVRVINKEFEVMAQPTLREWFANKPKAEITAYVQGDFIFYIDDRDNPSYGLPPKMYDKILNVVLDLLGKEEKRIVQKEMMLVTLNYLVVIRNDDFQPKTTKRLLDSQRKLSKLYKRSTAQEVKSLKNGFNARVKNLRAAFVNRRRGGH